MLSRVFKYFIGMGASQSGLRPMEPRYPSRAGLPNGDDLPCHMEDAPIDRVSKNTSNGSSSIKSAGSRIETNRESIRGSSSGILPVREISTRRVDGSTPQSLDQGSESRRDEDYASSRLSSISDTPETESRYANNGSASRASETRPSEIDGSSIPLRVGEETSKNCFLDKTRICGQDCMAFDPYWKHQPCSLLKALKVTAIPAMPPPPKVKP